MRTLIILISFFALLGCQSDESVEVPHYEMSVQIDPLSHNVKGKGRLKLPNRYDTIRKFSFYLHRELCLNNLKVNGTDQYTLKRDTSEIRYMPEAYCYTLTLSDNFEVPVVLRYDYEGKITSWPEWNASVIGKQWTEMGLYFPWYPYSPEIPEFSYDVGVKAPSEYNIFLMGEKYQENGTTRFRHQKTANDIVICASPELKVLKRKIDQSTVHLVYSKLSDTIIDSLQYDVARIISIYNKWFPENQDDFCIVESLRDKGGGYARKGGVYLAGLKNTKYIDYRGGYIRYLSHEIAHFWWKNADSNTWHDWLNEGFAEYAALAMIREVVGNEEFERRCRKKKEKCKNTVPVWECDRNGKQASKVLYAKAPLLLFDFERKVGVDAFRKFMVVVLRSETKTTSAFLKNIETQFDYATRQWFEAKLKEA